MEYTNFLQELTLFYIYNQLDITSFRDELDYLISLQNPDWITSHSYTWYLLGNIKNLDCLLNTEKKDNRERLKECLTDLLSQSKEIQEDYLCFPIIETTPDILIEAFSKITAPTREEYIKECFNYMSL